MKKIGNFLGTVLFGSILIYLIYVVLFWVWVLLSEPVKYWL